MAVANRKIQYTYDWCNILVSVHHERNFSLQFKFLQNCLMDLDAREHLMRY